MHLNQLMDLGAMLEPHTYRHTADRAEALHRLDRWARGPTGRPDLAYWLEKAVGHVHKIAWTARWASCGFPKVVIGHRLAASLMATRLAPDAAEAIRPPWTAYAVVLPTGLVPLRDRTANVERAADYLLVEREQDFSLVIAEVASSPFFIAGTSPSLVPPADASRDASDEWEGHSDYAPEARDHRTIDLAWRLVAGIEIELTDRSRVRVAGSGRPNKDREPRGESERTYVLTRQVVVDCRTAVRDRILGVRSSAPSVQVLVRGHWKWQPHGPENRQRKWIHVEGYWRGPEDAPIAVRPHEVGEPTQ
jgi:hypothetical protein